MNASADKAATRASTAGRENWLLLPPVLRRLRDLLVLLFALITLLFLLLPLAGDPAEILAGMDATPDQLAAIREKYGLDDSRFNQYLRYWGNLAQLDFGTSLVDDQPAMGTVLRHLPATLLLAVMAIVTTIAISLPVGTWLGFRPEAPARRVSAWVIFVMQGIPGFVFALILIQIFAVSLKWLPAIGFARPENWILPTLALASFLAPNLVRVIAANVSEAMREDYVRTAKAFGASPVEILWRHALPNALLGATALIGTQFAFLMSGSVIIESIFAWPGIGWLLMERIQSLDFPVIQAIAILIALLVFAINTLTDLSFHLLDPRLRRGASHG